MAALFLAMGLLMTITYQLTGFPATTDYEQLLNRGVFPDVLHERATAWEAIWGDAYRPLSDIMPDHGFEGVGGAVAPRPPSTLLLQTPLVLIGADALMPVVLIIILLLLSWVGWLVYSISGVEPWKLILATPLVLISLPVVSTLSYSPLGAILTVALILTSWRYQEHWWAGILLGIAAGLRLWPGLIVVGFWLSGRRRPAVAAVGTFVIVSGLGLLLPGVDLGSSLGSLMNAAEGWLNNNVNSSLALVLWPLGVPPVAAIALAGLAGVFAAYRNRASAIPITIVAAVIASPLSWPTYALAAFPVVALCLRRLSKFAVVGSVIPLAMWSLVPSQWIGHAHFAAILALFSLIVVRPGLVKATEATEASPLRSAVT